MNVGSLFSGCGLLDYGLHLAGFEHAWFCEADEFRRGILAQRWPGARVLDDVRSVRGDDVEPVALVAGGFPCKGASTVGPRTGFGHPETALWREQIRIIRELRPRYALVENVANILGLHDGAVWGEVLRDLDSLGYDIWWDCLPAAAFGAPHLRDRVFCVATDPAQLGHERNGHPRTGRVGSANGGEPVADAHESRADAHAAPGGSRPATGERDRVATDPDECSGRRERDADRTTDTDRRGRVEVAWGDYEPAIRRWEAIHGPSPEPLVPRMDARGAAGVDRSRLSALGDGVLVQAGHLIGRMIVDHASLIAQEEAA